jgi:acyl-CoA synthetase (NDP forming)
MNVQEKLYSGYGEMILKEQLDSMFNPRSVALIGASGTFGKWGFNILSLLLSDKSRDIYAVNNKEAEVLGLKAYGSILDVPAAIDLAVITVPFQYVPAAMEDCIQKKVKGIVVISGGLAETGEEGAKVQAQIAEIAKRGGIRFTGPNCMGIFDTSSNFNTVIFLPPLRKGPVALISQSGNSGQSIIISGLEDGLGFSKYVSSGNEADLHYEDYLEYMAQDEGTKVILGYIEGLREGRRFFKLAKQITKEKPIVVVKSGRTQAGASAARSHTAALAGADVVSDAAFKQAGVIRVDEINELIDVALLLLGQPLPRGRRVGVLSIGGGMAVMTADIVEKQGLELAPLSPATIEKLDTVLSRRWSHRNPVDMGGDRFNYSCLWPLMEDENIDAILVIGSPAATRSFIEWFSIHAPWITNIKEMRKMAEDKDLEELNKVKEMMCKYGKPVIFCSMGVRIVKQGEVYKWMEQNYLIPFHTPERAAKALSHLVAYSEYLGVSKF